MIAGDHIVGIGSAVLDFQNGDMSKYFKSTKELISLSPRLALPAHGPPSYSPVALLEMYLKHRTERENAILKGSLTTSFINQVAYNEGHESLDAIVSIVYKDVNQELWGAAKSNIALHLRKLMDEGRIPFSKM